jgi:hypothetical protein
MNQQKADSLRTSMKRIKEEIFAVQRMQQRYKPRFQYLSRI